MSVKQTELNIDLAEMFIRHLIKKEDAEYAFGYLMSMLAMEMDRNPKFRDRVLQRMTFNQQRAA